MRADRLALLATPIALLLLGAGCASSLAPRRWLPHAEEAQREAFGGWAELVAADGDSTRGIRGELLAISDDSVYTLLGREVTVTPLASVRRGSLEFYDPRGGDLAATTTAGALLTFTHGVGLVLTAPLWILVGTPSAAVLAGDGKLGLDPSLPRGQPHAAPGAKREAHASWRDLRIHARFPQGWPEGLDRTALHERPGRRPAPPAEKVQRGIVK